MSLSKVWNENERFKLVFTKLLVFTAKTGSTNSGTGPVEYVKVNSTLVFR